MSIPAMVGTDAGASTARSWTAGIGNVGSLGSNGEAHLVRYWTGAGRLDVRLRRLTPGGAYPLVLYRGPDVVLGTGWSARGWLCDAVSDGTLVRFSGTRSRSDGTLVRTIALSNDQFLRLVRYPRNLAIKVGTGSAARCGGFAPDMAKPSASPSPGSPSASASTGDGAPSPAPTCDPWPAAAAEVLAVLRVPDDLCLRTYPDASSAPAFVRPSGAFYVAAPGDRPAVYYIVGSKAGSEAFVLAHELCHAHQDQVARDDGGTFGDGWLRSQAGADFVAATDWTFKDGRWLSPDSTVYLNPLEDNADTCAIWFDRTMGPHLLRRLDPVRFGWAQRWLPLPIWITPYQPIQPTQVRDRADR